MSRDFKDRPLEDLQAGDLFRAGILDKADFYNDGAPLWHGWAVMDAFLAGIDYGRAPEQSIAISPLTEAFEQFKLAFISAGGTRNPKSASAKGWRPAEVVFTRLVRKDKHDPQAIVTGTQAYAAYMRRVIAADPSKVTYVPAPKPFLNGEQFMQDWDRAQCAKQGAPSMFDVARGLTIR